MKHARQQVGEATGHPLLVACGLADQLGFQLRMAQAAVWSDLVAALQPLGLRPSQYSVLLILRATPGSRQQDIGEALGIARPNLAAMIDALEKRGLVRRETNPADRRSHALLLTADGQALLAEADGAHSRHEQRLAERIGDADTEALLPVLRQLASPVQDDRG